MFNKYLSHSYEVIVALLGPSKIAVNIYTSF
jgi:hypothetical protein